MKDNKYSVANRTIGLILFATFFIIFLVYIASAESGSIADGYTLKADIGNNIVRQNGNQHKIYAIR